MKQNIAILLTCHNRKAKTIASLDAMYSADLPNNTEMDVFLVDDSSTDGTGETVKKTFQDVHVIQGTGNLFWNQGMRLAWQKATEADSYDFYLWLNDDTIIDKNAFSELFENYHAALKKDNKPAIIVGTCRSEKGSNEFSYGGRNESGPVLPNGKLQYCKYINGNLVLVPQAIFKQIGMLSNDYTHALGDNDYGLRAIQAGFTCYISKHYIATCPRNPGIPGWCNPDNSFKTRWQLLHTPTGLNIKEYNHYRKKFWGKKWMIFAVKAYLKTIIPTLYGKISKSK
ncbi:MAG: glycosyltransferase family 2 protein [Bacteroidales bacterium]|nr:glycosyltransferase family 2 protein [Bacteroidales bacterium]